MKFSWLLLVVFLYIGPCSFRLHCKWDPAYPGLVILAIIMDFKSHDLLTKLYFQS